MGLIAVGFLAIHLQAKWQPKTDLLPPDFVKTTQFLLDHGLPDVRGYDLRTIGDGRQLYFAIDGRPARNIVWMNPVNPAQSVDLTGLPTVANDAGRFASLGTGLPRLDKSMFPDHEPEIYDQGASSVQLVLLAVHGEESLVRKYLDFRSANRTYGLPSPVHALRLFLRSRFDQAIRDFLGERDNEALEGFTKIAQNLPDFEAFAKSIDPQGRETQYTSEGPRYYFSDLNDAATFRDDLLRKKLTPVRYVDLSTIQSKPVQEQVKILIDQLEFIGSKANNSSERFLYDAPQAIRLRQIGTQAVPQLLEALSSDKRYTRQLQARFSGPIQQEKPVPVHRIIQITLAQMAFKSIYFGREDKWHREYWSKNLGKSDAQRAYEALASDDPNWREACQAFLQDDAHPKNEFYLGVPGHKTALHVSVKPSMAAAKQFTKPSITEVLYRKIDQISVTGLSDFSRFYPANSAMEMAMASYYWDASASLPALKLASSKFLICLYQGSNDVRRYDVDLFGFMIDARKKLGDASYLDDQNKLADHLLQQSNVVNFESIKYFVDRIDEPSVRPFAFKLLFDPTSPYNLSNKVRNDSIDLRIAASPLVTTREGKDFTIGLLKNPSLVDQDKFIATRGMTSARGKDGSWVTVPVFPYSQIRVCDIAAGSFRQMKNAPAFSVRWPVSKRDQALKAMIQFVERVDAKTIQYPFDGSWLGYWVD